jgi:adenylate cyclase
MPDLIAQGRRPEDRWRRGVPAEGVQAVLGRTSQPWAVHWDDRISRLHAVIHWDGHTLQVRKLPEARNAIFFQGKQFDQFSCSVGEHFVIGQTTFTLLDQQLTFSQWEQPAIAEQTFSAHWLRNNKFKDAGRRIESLSKLPEIIASANDDHELCTRIVNLLLEGVPLAGLVAILKVSRTESTVGSLSHPALPTPIPLNPPTSGPSSPNSPDSVASAMTKQGADQSGANTQELVGLEVIRWDSQALLNTSFKPSASLVAAAVRSKETVLHVWNRNTTGDANFTQTDNVDWAFCTPVLAESVDDWAMYVAGQFPTVPVFGSQPSISAEQLQDDIKFAELAATTLGALRQVRALQRRQDSLRNFFAPVVLEAMGSRDPHSVLQPRETEVSVLFCDLRGFSRQSEESAERLLELLNRVSRALGVMTGHILDGGGVVGDFHGDAAMGFWGWPLADDRCIEKACLTALDILQEFSRSSADPNHPLANFRAGLGIASGPAVAGSIGTSDQVKVTVFGPVVNLASRLEGLTKQLEARILVDETTANWIRKQEQPSGLRVRRVAKVRPAGMKSPVMVSELLPPLGPDSCLTDENIVQYEQALDQFIVGDWNAAFRLLHQVPAEDQVKDFITFVIAQHRRSAPPDWQGVIEISSK